jgi:hypothetical protein
VIGSPPSALALKVLQKPLYFPALSLQPLKMETACLSETSASTCKYTRRQNPRPLQHDNNPESLKPHQIRAATKEKVLIFIFMVYLTKLSGAHII